MKKRILVHALLVVVGLALTAAIVFAEIELVGMDTKTNGVTTVTWDSRFADLDYTLDDTITMTVTWTVATGTGAAMYADFDLRCPDNGPPADSLGLSSPLDSPGLSTSPDPPGLSDPPPGRGCSSFTPRSKKDPANGELDKEATEVIDDSDDDDDGDGTYEGAVVVQFNFTDLHSCPRREVEMGNAHFKLYLDVDMDGDGELDKVVSYGVNVHVEDPQ